jgi:two-component system heavy metal sensor histidine kinase CusS
MSSASAEGAAGAQGHRATSIALRMTLAYALFTFTLVFLSGGLLYLTLVTSLDNEDMRDLADNLGNARLLLHGADGTPPPRLLRPSWAPAGQPEIYLRLLDSQGRVLTETPGMAVELAAPDPRELAQLPRHDGARRELRSRSGKPFLSLIVSVQRADGAGTARFMQVAMDIEHDESILAQYRQRLWLIFGTSLVLCSGVGYLIARAGLSPVATIARTAAHIRSSTLHERIETTGLPGELAGLAATFNGMLDRLEQSFAHVSRFSDDVAHELRTPVNNLRGEIEVALAMQRSSEDYREILSSCLEECTRIGRLIQTLLFLARADTSIEALQRENIDVADELTKVEDYYGAAALDAAVQLRIISASALHARLDRTLFQQAVGNLVSNAIAHTPPGGTVTVAASVVAERLTVQVSDTGCGIAPEHLPRVFDRFYRVDRTRGHPHNAGLGLAVVRSIATRHGGDVQIDSEVGRGTVVRVQLPA